MIYFNPAVGRLSGMAASGLTSNPVKNFMIREGMEKVVKDAYRTGTL
ncbi:hypothetical protein [Loktanella sp. M215]|nr:hypothetical protein [Loktanella sp. M215]MCF7699918.1 hypothetical protein [Loktanella sp. M215]